MKTNTNPAKAIRSTSRKMPERVAEAPANVTLERKIQRAANNAISTETDHIGEENTAYLLRQVAERLANSLTQSLRPFKQSTSVYRILIALTRRNPATMRELIELTLIEPSTLSRTVARMAE